MTKDKELEIIEAYKRIELDPNAFDNENTNIIKELYSRIPNVATEPSSTAVDFNKPQTQVSKILDIDSNNETVDPKFISSRTIIGQIDNIDPTEVTIPIPKDRPIEEYEKLLKIQKQQKLIKEESKQDITDAIVDFARNPAQSFPFVGTAMNSIDLAKIMYIANKVDNNEPLKKEEITRLNEFLYKTTADRTFGNQVVEVIKQLPAFMGEIGVGKIAFDFGKKATINTVKKIFSKNFKNKVQKLAKSKTTQVASKIVDKSAELATKATVGTFGGEILPGGGKATEGTRRRIMDQWIGGESIENIKTDDLKTQSIVDSYIEFLSEDSGPLLKYPSKLIKNNLLKLGILKNIANKTKKSKVYNDWLKKYGSYDGLIAEVGEERVGEALRGLAFELGIDDPNFKYEQFLPSAEQLGVEIVSLATPMGAGAIINKQIAKSQKTKRRKLDTELFNNQAWQEIQRAKKQNKITQEQAMLAEHFVSQDPKKYEDTSVLEINDVTKRITKQELESRGQKFSDFGLSEDTQIADIAGTTEFQTFDGVRKVLIGIYNRSDESTVVEEFLGHFYKTMSPQDKKTWDNYYEKYNGDLNKQELYEKEGLNYFFETKQYDKSIPTRLYQKLKELYQRITGQVDKSVLDLYKRGSRGQISGKVTQQSDKSFEVKEVEDENQLNVAREKRKTIQAKNVKLTKKEKKLILDSNLDVDKKDIANTIKGIKAKYPKKDGWSEIEVANNTYSKGKVSKYSISLNKSGNIEVAFKGQQYTFGLGKNGKIAQGKERKKLETKLGNRVVKEVLNVVERAKKGDKNAQTILKQKTWYSSLKQGIREQYGGFLDLFSEALGVLSPLTDVNTNYKNAEIFLEEYTKGNYDSMIEPFVKYIEQGGNINNYKGPVPLKPNGAKYGTNSAKSLAVLASMWIELKPGMSPKARNFAGNILGKIDRATIDVWAGRFLQRVSGGKRIPPKAEMAVSGNVLKSGEYGGNFGIGGGAFAHAVNKLNRMNIKELEGLDTPSLQAVVWFLEKELWTKNNWTTKSGEGGSFESNLLRETIPEAKGGGTAVRDYSRTQFGMSRQQGKKEPSSKEIKELQDEIIKTTIGDSNIKVVRAESSLGLYENKPEKSYDTELVTTKDYYPTKVVSKVIEYAKKDNQDAVFVSKVLKPGEDHPNSRPGLEVYFNKNLSEADTKPLIKMIMDNGFDGFTFIREQRTPENQYTGVRIQVVPEFSARYDSELREQFKDKKFFEEWMDSKEKDLSKLFFKLDSKYLSYDINKNEYITEVHFNEEYDKRAKILKTPEGAIWSRSSSYSQVQETTRESEESQRESGQDLDRDKKKTYQLKPQQKKYFKDTKVVDSKGNPKVVYHGTVGEFDAFYPYSYFTSSPEYASDIADGTGFGGPRGWGQNVKAVYLNIKNPKRYKTDDEYEDYVMEGPSSSDNIEKLEEQGYDGIIFEPEGGGEDVIIAFKPNQIKSVHNENPTDDDRMSFQLKPFKSQVSNLDTFELKPETKRAMFVRNIVDRMNRLKQVQESIGDIPEDLDAYLDAELFIGKARFRVEKFEDYYTKLIERITNNYTVDEFGDYLYALHAKERDESLRQRFPDKYDENDNPSGMSNEVREEILGKYKKDKLINRLVKDFYKNVTNKNLQNMYESGLITDEAYEQLNNTYKNYVPLKGIDNGEDVIPNIGKGFSTQGKDIRRAYGRKSLADNPFINALSDFQIGILRSEKNEVGKTLYNLALENPNNKLWEVKGLKYKPRYDKEGDLQMLDPEMIGIKDFIVRVDGKIKKITIRDNALLTGLKNLGGGKAIPLLMSANTFFRATATYYNPEFLITNFERDIQSAGIMITGEQSATLATKVIANVPSAMKGIWRYNRGKQSTDFSNLYEEYKSVGGTMGWMDNETIEQKVQKLEKRLKSPGSLKVKAISKIKPVFDFVEDMNDSVENAVRLATFKIMRENGYSTKRSASIAKNVTINFNKKGEQGSLLNSMYLFANAGIQGTNRVVNAVYKNAKIRKIAFGLVGMGFINGVLNRMIDEDEWDQIDDFVKDTNYIVLLNNGKKLTIKLPYGWNFFYGLGSTAENFIRGDGDARTSLLRLFDTAMNSFNPISGGSLLQTVIPTIGDPIAQIYENKTWNGGPIYPVENPYGPKKPDVERYFPKARPLSITTAKEFRKLTKNLPKYTGGIIDPVDVSPETLDFMFDFVSGGTGRFLANTIQTGSSLFSGELPPLRRIPFVRSKLSDKTPYKSERMFYNILDKSKKKVFSKTEILRWKKYGNFVVQNGRMTRTDFRKKIRVFNDNQKKARDSFK